MLDARTDSLDDEDFPAFSCHPPTHKEARLLGECETKLGQQLAMKCGKRAIVAFTCVKEFRAADSPNDGGLLHSIRYNWARRRI